MVEEKVKVKRQKAKIRKSICLFCSLGCGVAFRAEDENIIAIDYDKENPVNKGSLCPRGHYNLDLINHPQRLTEPHIGNRKASWDEALDFAKNELKKFKPESIGIIISSLSSNEDAYLGAKLAKSLGTNNITTFQEEADHEAYKGNRWDVPLASSSKVEKIGESEALLIIGDILTRSPVLSKRINQVKYGKRGNQIIVIDPNATHTSWFATTHLRNKPGTEALLTAALLKIISEENKRGAIDLDLKKVSETAGIPAEVIIKTAKAFDMAPSGTIIFAPSENKERNDLIQYFIKLISTVSLNKNFITFYGYGNVLGTNTILDALVPNRARYKDVIGKKAVLMFGGDIALSPGSEFLAVSSFFMPDNIHQNMVIFPLSSHIERKGSVTFAGNRKENFTPLAHKIGSRSGLEIMAALMGQKMEFDDILDQTKDVLMKGAPKEKADLKEKISEAQMIKGKEFSPIENITHFGDNNLVKKFFWYKVNNKNG